MLSLTHTFFKCILTEFIFSVEILSLNLHCVHTLCCVSFVYWEVLMLDVDDTSQSFKKHWRDFMANKTAEY